MNILKLKRKIERTERMILTLKEKHGNFPSKDYTYHAGWDLGYYQGVLSVYLDLLDDEEDELI